MANPKDVLVITSSSPAELKIKQYLKPISAHIVAGTNLFSDFLGGITDVFGGRSQSYQKQLTSLYNEAIEKIKYAAYEIGANCVVGLNIDMDEISGKGKSMFMLTAIGTAIILEKEEHKNQNLPGNDERLENVGFEKINVLRRKKELINKSKSGQLLLNQDSWDFLTTNQVDEVFPIIFHKFGETISRAQLEPEILEKFYKQFVTYIDNLPEHKKRNLLYGSIKNEKNQKITAKISQIICELNLYDFERTIDLLTNENFQVQKQGIRIATYDKPFYSKQDIQDLEKISQLIKEFFTERGTKTTKKQLLSSKEKEVWNCECGKTNDIGSYCSGCGQDIFGFKEHEMKPYTVTSYIEEKINLITEYIK